MARAAAAAAVPAGQADDFGSASGDGTRNSPTMAAAAAAACPPGRQVWAGRRQHDRYGQVVSPKILLQ